LFHTWHEFPVPDAAAEDLLCAKWNALRALRAEVNKEIELLRSADQLGSSLQAEVDIEADDTLLPVLQSLGDDLKFVLIVSQVNLIPGSATRITVRSLHCQPGRAGRGASSCLKPDMAPAGPGLRLPC
jgi:isoleucyl-tRNA synthetase